MATKVELPKDMVKTLIENGMALRQRQIKQATNPLIKTALEDELSALSKSRDTIIEAK